MIELNEKNLPKKNNLSLLRSLFLLKKNFPSYDAFYFVLFFLKYLGIIVQSRLIEMATNKEGVSFNKYFKNIFFFGNDFCVMYKNYFAICIFGAIIILIFYIYSAFCFLYMKYKYKNITSIIDEKAHGTDEIFEEKIFKILSSISTVFIFFHHYIIEYYSFGIYAFIYSQIGITSKIGVSKHYSTTLEIQLIEYLDENNHLPLMIINLIVIILVISNLSFFIMFNSVRGLFLRAGIYCGNVKYVISKLIMINFQPFFVLTQFYSDDTKITIGIIFNIIIFLLCLMSFSNYYHEFAYYPNSIANMCLYIEFFVFVSSIDEIIIYFVGYKETTIFFFVKIILEIINSYILMQLLIFLKDRNNIKIFSKNLFSKNSTDISKGGLYHYMRVYLDYQKDKNLNYIKLFRIILEHVKNCKKIECPGQILISQDNLKSAFIPFSYKEKPDHKNNIFINRENTKEKKEELTETNNASTHDSEKNNIKIIEEPKDIDNENNNKNKMF